MAAAATALMAYGLLVADGTVVAQSSGTTTTTTAGGSTTTTVSTQRDRYSPAVVRGNHWFIRNSFTSGASTSDFFYGDVGDAKLLCDWNGDGVRTPGVRRGITFYLRDAPISNGAGGGSDRAALNFGNLGDVPICGDWDGNGSETIGVVRNDGGTLKWFMHNSNTPGQSVSSPVFFFGNNGDTPTVGDWDGNGSSNPGVRRGITFFFRNSNNTGPGDGSFGFGDPNDQPVTGDWDGAQGYSVGVFRNGTWYLRNTNSATNASLLVPPFGFGQGGDAARVAATP